MKGHSFIYLRGAAIYGIASHYLFNYVRYFKVLFVYRDDPIYFVRFELPLIPLIDWNLEILHKCHNYFELYKLLLMSKSILVALFWTPYFFLSALVAFFGLSCPLQSWKHQHTNEKCYQNNILCLVNKNYDFFCNPLINFISNYQI